jgi:fucose permease
MRYTEASLLKVTGYVAFLIIGWATVLLPQALKQIENSFHINDAQVGLYFFFAAFMSAGGALLYGHYAKRLSFQSTILWFVGLAAALCIAQAICKQWVIFFVFGAFGALFNSAMDAAVNHALLEVTPPSQAGKSLNRLHLAFGVGSAIGALVIGKLLLSNVAWQTIFMASGLVALVLVIGLHLAKFNSKSVTRITAAENDEQESFTKFIANNKKEASSILLLVIAIGLYVGSEIGLNNWLPSYYAGINKQAAAIVLSSFWIGLTLGRLIIGGISDSLSIQRSLYLCCFFGTVAFILSLFISQIWAAILLVGLSGVFYGPIYPLIMVRGGQLFKDHIGAVSGVLTASAMAGGAIIPAFLGLLSSRDKLELGLAMATSLLLLVAACLQRLGHIEKQHNIK